MNPFTGLLIDVTASLLFCVWIVWFVARSCGRSYWWAVKAMWYITRSCILCPWKGSTVDLDTGEERFTP